MNTQAEELALKIGQLLMGEVRAGNMIIRSVESTRVSSSLTVELVGLGPQAPAYVIRVEPK